MPNSIPGFRLYAPYVYVTKGQADGKYVLYISILHPTNVTINAPTVNSYNGSTIVSYLINVTEANSPKTRRYDRLEVEVMLNETQIENINESQPEIRVAVKVEDNQGNTLENREITAVIYPSSLDNTLAHQGTIAYGCPYAYLTNPYNETGESTQNYAPRCYVPLQKMSYNAAAQSAPDILTNPGRCEQILQIFDDLNSVITEVAEADIPINKGFFEYSDPGRDNEFFYARVEKKDDNNNTTTTTTKLPNRSSDTHPNSFID